MSILASDDNAASELIGYVYTASVSVLILASMMVTSSTMLNGNITNTAQEDAEQIAHFYQKFVILRPAKRFFPTNGILVSKHI